MSDLSNLASPPANSADEIASIFGLDFEAPEASTPAADPAPEAATPSAPEQPAPAPAPVETPAALAAPLPDLTAPTAAPASPAPAPAGSAAPAAPVAPDATALELASLRAQVAALEAQRTAPAPQAPGTPAQPTVPAAAEDAPQYALSIPNELGQAILSDDPATSMAGMTHLVNSLAVHVHQKVIADVQQRQAARDAVAAESRAVVDEAAQIQKMQSDYYGAYPTHSNPAIKAIVGVEASAMATAYPHLPWGPDYMNALGARVNTRLAELGVQTQQPSTPAAPTAPTAPRQPAAFAPAQPSRGSLPAFEAMDGQINIIESTFAP